MEILSYWRQLLLHRKYHFLYIYVANSSTVPKIHLMNILWVWYKVYLDFKDTCTQLVLCCALLWIGSDLIILPIIIRVASLAPNRSWYYTNAIGLYSLKICRLMGLGIPIINLRRSDDHLRFIMGIPITIRRCIFSEWRPWGIRVDRYHYI